MPWCPSKPKAIFCLPFENCLAPQRPYFAAWSSDVSLTCRVVDRPAPLRLNTGNSMRLSDDTLEFFRMWFILLSHYKLIRAGLVNNYWGQLFAEMSSGEGEPHNMFAWVWATWIFEHGALQKWLLYPTKVTSRELKVLRCSSIINRDIIKVGLLSIVKSVYCWKNSWYFRHVDTLIDMSTPNDISQHHLLLFSTSCKHKEVFKFRKDSFLSRTTEVYTV